MTRLRILSNSMPARIKTRGQRRGVGVEGLMTSATIAHAPSSTSTNTIAEKRPPMRDTREGYGIENNKSNSKSRY